MALVQRDEQLGLIERLIQDSGTDRGSLVLVNGPAGCGVTTLLQEVATRVAAAGAIVLRTFGSESERDLPFELVAQLWTSAETGHPENSDLHCLSTSGHASSQYETTGYATVARRLWNWISGLAAHRTIVILVDDVQYADEQSAQCLSFLARRLSRARVVMVLGNQPHLRIAHPRLSTELLSLPNCHRTRVGPLNISGAVQLAATFDIVDDEITEQLWSRSGGNPLLLTALLEDHKRARNSTTRAMFATNPNEAFADAVLTCLYRCEQQVIDTARLLATVGADMPSHLIESLLRSEASPAIPNLSVLDQTGLLYGFRFRDPVAKATVLHAVSTEQRAELHLRVAECLHDSGATCDVVAKHLLLADSPLPAWAVPILHEAGVQELDSGRPEEAVTVLTVAHRESTHERQGAMMLALLADAEWQIDPPTAMRRLTELVDLAANGHLRRQELARIVGRLLWCGRYADTQRLLSYWDTCPKHLDEGRNLEHHVLEMWVKYTYPVLLEADPSLLACDDAQITSAEITASPGVQAALLTSALLYGDDADLVGGAERLLENWDLRSSTFSPLSTALSTLIQADRTDLARVWCDRLLARASELGVTTWIAALHNISAEISLSEGDFAGALKSASAALERLPALGWGVTIGRPMATFVLAATALGEYEQAADLLRQPVPDVMFQCRYGLYYWHARGHYYLARDRPQLAIDDFRACGDRMVRWRLDSPQVLPWRADLARAYLRMGEHAEAEKFLEEQLAMTAPRFRGLRGIALRLLATTRTRSDRLPIIEEAVALLRQTRVRHELSAAISQLNDTRRLGPVAQTGQAPLHTLVEIETSTRQMQGTASAPVIQPQAGRLDTLSQAELRVAALAARGHTNHHIARRLFITVSTVEQHLTHAYRKLGVRGRRDLPKQLRLSRADLAG
ncbi:ATP-binding protein [Nocardia sp. NPDC051570]|uniref:ATP-binding protein n=1 Tax=Nocardia sp. NPDC051570 TaxID=3364324 RepID=UPI0037A8E4C7